MSDTAENNRPGGDEALKSRLDTLTRALDEKRQDQREAAEARQQPAANAGIGKAMGTGFRVASELAAAILVGGGLGLLIDRMAGTSPWFLLILLTLGIGAGFWNVYKLAARSGAGETPPQL